MRVTVWNAMDILIHEEEVITRDQAQRVANPFRHQTVVVWGETYGVIEGEADRGATLIQWTR